jgi:hypothetical protein
MTAFICLYLLHDSVSGRDYTGIEYVKTNDTIAKRELEIMGKERERDRIYLLSRVCIEELRKFTES